MSHTSRLLCDGLLRKVWTAGWATGQSPPRWEETSLSTLLLDEVTETTLINTELSPGSHPTRQATRRHWAQWFEHLRGPSRSARRTNFMLVNPALWYQKHGLTLQAVLPPAFPQLRKQSGLGSYTSWWPIHCAAALFQPETFLLPFPGQNHFICNNFPSEAGEKRLLGFTCCSNQAQSRETIFLCV